MIATAAALNCEFMQMGVGGSGWVITPAGTSGFGTFPTWWNKLNSATTISFSPAPNFVFVPLGVNDHGQNYAAISSAVSGWIPTARSTFGSSASIFIVAPLRDNNATTSTVQTAIQAGIAAASDAHTFYIPMGTEFQNAVFAPSGTITGTPTWISLDDGHPLAQYHGIIASIVTAFTMKILYQQQYQPTHVLLGGIGFPWWMGALLAVWLGFNLIWRATEGRRRRSNNTATERTGR